LAEVGRRVDAPALEDAARERSELLETEPPEALEQLRHRDVPRDGRAAGRVLQDVVERVEDVLVRLDAVAPILPDQLLDPRFEGESGHRSLRAPHRRGAPRFPIGASVRPPERKKPMPRDAGRSDLDRWGGPLPGPRRLGVARAHPSSDGSTGPSSTSTESS